MGWDKKTQEKFPESWARMHRTLVNNGYIGMKGKKQSDFQKKRAKEANIGNKNGVGHIVSIEHRNKLAELRRNNPGTNTGKKFSKETIKRMSKGQKKAHWKYNKTPKEVIEICRKISVARSKQILPLQDTSIEMLLQNELSKRGVVFEKHKNIYGLPDIFIKPNICIFADGDYWHANPLRFDLGKKIRFGEKILTAEQIREKDEKTTKRLTDLGYRVFRFWESDIKKDVKSCVDKILLDKTIIKPILKK